MKTCLILIFCTVFFENTSAQQKHGRHATEAEQELYERSRDCARNRSMSLTERLKHYPFNKAKAIQLVSFQTPADSVWGDVIKPRLPRENDTICYSKLFEINTLESAQIDTLTDLLYNYGRKSVYSTEKNIHFTSTTFQCYYPRNAILFVDKNKRVFAFIEICFECDKMEVISEKIRLGPMCNQKLLLLRDFFRASGIQYGVGDMH